MEHKLETNYNVLKTVLERNNIIPTKVYTVKNGKSTQILFIECYYTSKILIHVSSNIKMEVTNVNESEMLIERDKSVEPWFTPHILYLENIADGISNIEQSICMVNNDGIIVLGGQNYNTDRKIYIYSFTFSPAPFINTEEAILVNPEPAKIITPKTTSTIVLEGETAPLAEITITPGDVPQVTKPNPSYIQEDAILKTHQSQPVYGEIVGVFRLVDIMRSIQDNNLTKYKNVLTSIQESSIAFLTKEYENMLRSLKNLDIAVKFENKMKQIESDVNNIRTCLLSITNSKLYSGSINLTSLKNALDMTTNMTTCNKEITRELLLKQSSQYSLIIELKAYIDAIQQLLV